MPTAPAQNAAGPANDSSISNAGAASESAQAQALLDQMPAQMDSIMTLHAQLHAQWLEVQAGFVALTEGVANGESAQMQQRFGLDAAPLPSSLQVTLLAQKNKTNKNIVILPAGLALAPIVTLLVSNNVMVQLWSHNRYKL